MTVAYAMIILAPLLIKLGIQSGLNPIHLGAIVVVNFAVGMETPPLGYSLFVASAFSGLSKFYGGVIARTE
ncbi:MAG: TRAP transporter large permease subunit [Desulfobacterales bacterium]|nr:TRAP transporter large permease subunit [Desulfobacterales bacterium]